MSERDLAPGAWVAEIQILFLQLRKLVFSLPSLVGGLVYRAVCNLSAIFPAIRTILATSMRIRQREGDQGLVLHRWRSNHQLPNTWFRQSGPIRLNTAWQCSDTF